MEHFCPAVKEFCAKNNLAYKALLIIDNAPGHPRTLDTDEVKVVFLPPNTTPLLQPMDQGVIAAFKAYYLRKTFTQALEATDKENGKTLKEFWKGYNIYNAVKNIGCAWGEVTATCMNAVWRKLYEDCVQDFLGFDDANATTKDQIVDIGKQIGLEDVDTEDIEDLLSSHSEEMSNEDLLELEFERNKDEEFAEQPSSTKLTAKGMHEAFEHLQSFISYFEENDPDMNRSVNVRNQVSSGVNCYKLLYEEMKKQKKQQCIEVFFKKM